MRYWFDTEFIDDGRAIDLISIGIVAADGRWYYAESADCDLGSAGEWVRANVLPKLSGDAIPRRQIADEIRTFVGERPEFWAYFAAYDWVALCQLYSTMMSLPDTWPNFCLDLKQALWLAGDPVTPWQDDGHNALDDARWTKATWEWLHKRSAAA